MTGRNIDKQPITVRPQWHFLIALLGIALLSWPILDIPARQGAWALYGYMFFIWAALIAAAVVFARAIGIAEHARRAARDGGKE